VEENGEKVRISDSSSNRSGRRGIENIRGGGVLPAEGTCREIVPVGKSKKLE
jgi:hypothetical protein